jgi:hypothetical protein
MGWGGPNPYVGDWFEGPHGRWRWCQDYWTGFGVDHGDFYIEWHYEMEIRSPRKPLAKAPPPSCPENNTQINQTRIIETIPDQIIATIQAATCQRSACGLDAL